jgi:hypothetical protein
MTCPFSRNVWPGPDEKVHLVMTDELSPPNDVLGVFWSYDEANSFWTEIQGRFANRTTLVVAFPAGYRYDGGTDHYRRMVAPD